MARPLVDTSALRRPIGFSRSGWAEGLQQAAKGLARGLEKRADIKRKEEQQFISAMSEDLNDVSNDLFKTHAVNQYDKIRGKWVDTFKGQRGWLTPEQKIQMQSDLKKYQGEIEYLNSLSKYNDAAMQAKQKDPGLEYKSDDWMNFVKAVNSGDTEAARQAGSVFMESDAGIPGTTLIPANPNDALVSLAPDIMKNFKKEEIGSQLEFKTDKDGNKYRRTNISYKNGDPEMFKQMLGGSIANSKYGNRYEKLLRQSLTPEQQKEAMLTYPENNPLVRYWANNMLDDNIVREFTGDKTDYGTWTQVSGAGGDGDGPGSGRGWTSIQETDIGWDFGTTPVSISKTIDGQTYKNASVVSVKKDDQGNYSAELIVPKGKNEFMSIVNKAREEGRDLTNEELAFIQSEVTNPDKYKNVSVALEDVYDELKAGFNKKKLNLQGYENITFPEEIQSEVEQEPVDDSDPLGLGL